MASSELNETPSLWLKAQTRSEHLATEQTSLAKKLATGTLSMKHFVCLLASYQRLHADVELRACVSGLLSFVSRPSKSEWAYEDLRALSVEHKDLPEELLSAFDSELPKLPSSSRAFVLGQLYVMEGSALGAVMLGPVVERSLGLTAGMRYFRGAGKDTMPRWLAFRAKLDQELTDERSREQAREGANRQFALVHTIFDVLDACADQAKLPSLEATGS